LTCFFSCVTPCDPRSVAGSALSHHPAKCKGHGEEEEAKSKKDHIVKWANSLELRHCWQPSWVSMLLVHGGFDSSWFRHSLWANVYNRDIFPNRKEKVCKLKKKKKEDWIRFGSVSCKHHKAYLSSLLTLEHICVRVFCFSFLQ
jgi:hypothetical protein